MSRFSRRRRLGASLAVLVVLGVGVGACGDDDDGASGDEDATTTTRPTTTESDVESGGSSELTQQVQDLLTSYDDVLARIARDPEAASNRDDALYSELRALVTPNSVMIEPLINGLVAAGTRGERQLPGSGSHLPVERLIEGTVDTVSAGELRAYVCGYMNYGVFNSSDQQIQLAEQHVEPTQATIVRADGELRIERFDPVEENRCMGGPR